MAENAWNTRDPGKVALACMPGTRRRNRAEFLSRRAEVRAFLTRKWEKEHDYQFIKELWAFDEAGIAVRFCYECLRANCQELALGLPRSGWTAPGRAHAEFERGSGCFALAGRAR